MMQRKKLLIGLGSVITIIVLLIIFVLYSSSDITSVINKQLSAIRSNDINKVYSYTSKEFQNSTKIEDFQKFIESYPALKNNESISILEKEVKQDRGVVKVILKSKDGATTPATYYLVKEAGDWKIIGIEINNADESNDLSKLFDNTDSHYSIKYPSSWDYEKTGPGTVVFSGKNGTQSYFSTVNIQTVLTKKTGGDFTSVKDFMTDLKKQAKSQSPNANFTDSGPIQIKAANGMDVKGEFVTFIYDYKEKTFKQWQIVVMRGDEQVFYAWAYTALVDRYDVDLPVAEAMLKTWTIY